MSKTINRRQPLPLRADVVIKNKFLMKKRIKMCAALEKFGYDS